MYTYTYAVNDFDLNEQEFSEKHEKLLTKEEKDLYLERLMEMNPKAAHAKLMSIKNEQGEEVEDAPELAPET